jgi:hypothetical protein
MNNYNNTFNDEFIIEMKYNDFVKHIPKMVKAAQEIIKQNGHCRDIVCYNCPAFKKNRKDNKCICSLWGIIYKEKRIKFASKEYFCYRKQYAKQYLNLIQRRKLQLLKNEV